MTDRRSGIEVTMGRQPRWQKPKPGFPIDDEVEGLIQEGRWFRKYFEGDPYMTARCYLGRAVSLATNKERQQLSHANRRRDLKKLEDKIGLVVKLLEKIAIEAAPVLARPVVSGGWRDLKKLEDKIGLVVKRLEKIAIEAAPALARPVVSGGKTLDPENEFKRRDLPDTALAGVQALPGAAWPTAFAGVQALAAGTRAHREKIRQKSEKVFVSVFIEEIIYCGSALLAMCQEN